MDQPYEIFRMSRDELMSVSGIGPMAADAIAEFDNWERVDQILQQAEKLGSILLTPAMKCYPYRLKEIYDPPPLMWLRGNQEILCKTGIAVVGTRNPTPYGRKMAESFTRALVENGLTIISGLAYGIDTVAHQTTIEAGGLTIAVLGSGIDNIYPSSNRKLAEEIINTGGAVLSEFPPGSDPDAGNFPVRNRIVSGMSVGVLVVESGVEGGSMITARSALDQNREVFVVPHPLDTISGKGCNYLIKNSLGKLVQEVSDILSEIPSFHTLEEEKTGKQKPAWKSLELDEEALKICHVLENGPIHIDILCDQMDVSPHIMLQRLFELELLDCIKQKPGKYFSLTY